MSLSHPAKSLANSVNLQHPEALGEVNRQLVLEENLPETWAVLKDPNLKDTRDVIQGEHVTWIGEGPRKQPVPKRWVVAGYHDETGDIIIKEEGADLPKETRVARGMLAAENPKAAANAVLHRAAAKLGINMDAMIELPIDLRGVAITEAEASHMLTQLPQPDELVAFTLNGARGTAHVVSYGSQDNTIEVEYQTGTKTDALGRFIPEKSRVPLKDLLDDPRNARRPWCDWAAKYTVIDDRPGGVHHIDAYTTYEQFANYMKLNHLSAIKKID